MITERGFLEKKRLFWLQFFHQESHINQPGINSVAYDDMLDQDRIECFFVRMFTMKNIRVLYTQYRILAELIPKAPRLTCT